MKKYLVVISYCEEETYLFDSLDDMFNFFDVSSISELLKKSSTWCYYIVYEISKIWEE